MNSHKLFLIIQREFMTRVRSKGFIISTILAPFGILLLFLAPIGFQMLESDETPVVAIIDNRGGVADLLQSQNPDRYIIENGGNVESLRSDVVADRIQGLLIIPEADSAEISFFYTKGGLDFTSGVRREAADALKRARVSDSALEEDVKQMLLTTPGFNTTKITEEGESDGNEMATFLFGYVLGFFIYIAIFIYGAMVMRGVIEEKSSRIMEVIVSSVTPFELMMGKIIGIGSVGLLQFALWTILSNGVMFAVAPLLAGDASSSTAQATASSGFSMPVIEWYVWVAFIFFFLAGYLIYSAVFAAIGSAVDNEQDAQQLQLPVTLPIIVPIMMVAKVVADPNSTLSVVASMIPLFSPILMMVRIAVTDVPLWQWGTSVLLMAATFTGLVWLAARVYRVGVLMYGKKPTFKELARWVKLS
jgi:ABC-2 type transport system permease protein